MMMASDSEKSFPVIRKSRICRVLDGTYLRYVLVELFTAVYGFRAGGRVVRPINFQRCEGVLRDLTNGVKTSTLVCVKRKKRIEEDCTRR